MDSNVRAGSTPASSTKKYLQKTMKQLFIIAAMVTFTACSNETATTTNDSTCTDSTCMDSLATDSLIKSTEAHADSLHTAIVELKK